MTTLRRLTLLAVCMALLTSCASVKVVTPQVIPDQTIAHQLATPAQVNIWVRRADGKYVQQLVTIPDGWWVASPFAK